MRNNEQGRSMIEMLGVLAIVGVLSVGGIAGYSKAMGKFKTNKAIDQVNMLTTNIRTLYSSQRSYEGLGNAVARSMNLVPAEMQGEDSGDINNAFGGTLTIEASGAVAADDMKAFTITMEGIPGSSCIAIVTTDWGSDADGGLIAFGTGDLSEVYAGNAGTANSVHVPGSDDAGTSIPYSVSAAATECDEATVTLRWKYM